MCSSSRLGSSFVIQCDQAREGFFQTHEQMDAYCKEKGFIGWFETSAKENINIDESAKFLLGKVSDILLLEGTFLYYDVT